MQKEGKNGKKTNKTKQTTPPPPQNKKKKKKEKVVSWIKSVVGLLAWIVPAKPCRYQHFWVVCFEFFVI